MVEVTEDDKVRVVKLVDYDDDLADKENAKEGAGSDPYEGGAGWQAQREVMSSE